MKKIRILYIDDNPLDRALVRDSLEHEHGGFILTEADSQKQFEQLIKDKVFDVVLTDFNILGYEGLQVLDHINENYSNIPVIIVTGTGSEEVAVESIKRGAADYVIKTPKHISRLPVTINAVLESRRVKLESLKTEESLKIHYTKYKTLFDLLPAGLTISDEKGNIIESNVEAEKLLGLSVEAQKQRKIDGEEWKIIKPDGTDMPTEEYASVIALAENRTVLNVEMGIDKGNNNITWINVSATPIPLENYGVMIIYYDISKRKEIENENKDYQFNLEQKVKDRTSELEEQNKELERFNKLFIDREFRIKELKDKIGDLENKLMNDKQGDHS